MLMSGSVLIYGYLLFSLSGSVSLWLFASVSGSSDIYEW